MAGENDSLIDRKRLRLYDRVLADIILAKPLSGENARIFMFLLGNIDKENKLPPPSVIASAMGLLRPNVSRGYQELMANGYLVKGEDRYSIHPMIAYYGTESGRTHAVEKLMVGKAYRPISMAMSYAQRES